MKTTSLLLIAVAQLLVIAPSEAAQVFVSSFARQSIPSAIGVVDWQNGGSLSHFVAIPDIQITANLMIDADSLTARFSGSTQETVTTFSYTTGTSTQQIGMQNNFPNPPTPIFAEGYGSMTITLTMNDTTFDTGLKNLSWNGSTYVFPVAEGVIGSIAGVAEITHSVTSGGQTATSTEYALYAVSILTNGILNLDDYPANASVPLSLRLQAWDGLDLAASAPNGFTLSYQLVPEPSSALLLSAGVLCLASKRRRA